MGKTLEKLRNGDDPFSDVPNKINEIIDTVNSMRLVGDKKTIMVNESAYGTTISAISSGGVASSPSASASGKSYTGAFYTHFQALTSGQKVPTIITVDEGYVWYGTLGRKIGNYDGQNVLISSLDKTGVGTPEHPVTCNKTNYIYLTYHVPTTQIHIGSCASDKIPVTTTVLKVYIIAVITYSDKGKEQIEQWQYGDIHISDNEYLGYFSVLNLLNTTTNLNEVTICNGANPSDTLAGTITVDSGVLNCQKTVISNSTLATTNGFSTIVYIRLFFGANGYAYEFKTVASNLGVPSVPQEVNIPIATITTLITLAVPANGNTPAIPASISYQIGQIWTNGAILFVDGSYLT